MALIDLDHDHALSYFSCNEIAGRDSVIFLHGIMGSKKNLQSFVRKFVQNHPNYSALVFDLRNHGESSKHWAPFTVDACASDIALACEKLSIKPTAIIGHSFGGKVAMMAAFRMHGVKQVWLWDCPPGQIQSEREPSRETSFTTLSIIEILESFDWPVASRKALVEQLLRLGVSNAIALWMTTNLIMEKDGLRLIFDPAEMKAMLLDFLRLDGWPVVASLGHHLAVHIVAAERGQRVSENDQQILKRLLPTQGYFHVLKNAGHFVHADNPNGLISLMTPYF